MNIFNQLNSNQNIPKDDRIPGPKVIFCHDNNIEQNEYHDRFSALSNQELVDAFNSDVGKAGWVGARGRFHSALHYEFLQRDIDISAIGDIGSISLARTVELEENTLIPNQ